MKKIEHLDDKVQRGQWKHEQHTSDFRKELYKPVSVQEPFRISDGVLKVGQYKGMKVEDTPLHYVKWICNNFQHLSKTHRGILEDILKQKSNIIS
jgi:uncharacterized protein (DUF3820 family)